MPRNLQTQASLNTCSQKLTTKISSSLSAQTHSYSSACASCKYQRKKCSSECLLAPYFPPTHQTEFLKTHKLFGVSNISKIIKSLDHNPLDKEAAMRTMIYQAEIRSRDPVGGCAQLVCDLQRRIARCRAELDFVLNQIDLYRAQTVDVNVNDVPPSDNEDGIINSFYAYNNLNHQNLLQQQRQYYNVIMQDYDEGPALNPMWRMELTSQNDGLINMMESNNNHMMESNNSPAMDDLNQQQQSSSEDPDVQ